MDATYIIFKRTSRQSTPVWVETVQGLEKSKKRLLAYSSDSTEDYYLFDVLQARILELFAKSQTA